MAEREEAGKTRADEGASWGNRESKASLVGICCKHRNSSSSLLHSDGGKAKGWMVYVVVFTSKIKHFSGAFLIHLLVCQAFILDSVLTCEKMLEDSARVGKGRECDFYHRMVRGKKRALLCQRGAFALYTLPLKNWQGQGEEPVAAIVLWNFSSFKMIESFI